jgi:hypothetical protein
MAVFEVVITRKIQMRSRLDAKSAKELREVLKNNPDAALDWLSVACITDHDVVKVASIKKAHP